MESGRGRAILKREGECRARICHGGANGFPADMANYQAPEGLGVGHVHLKVSDLARAEAFYREVLGLAVTQRYGSQALFMSAGGYHHHVGFNTWMSRGGRPPAAGATGLFHVAFLYPTRADLARAVRQVLACGVELDGAADHGVSHAVYFRDPDENGIELCWDLPRDAWPRDGQGGLAMVTEALDLEGLLAEAR